MTTKEKIDQALGISGGKSLDQMLDDLNVQADEFHNTFDSLDDSINAEFRKIDEKALELQRADVNGALVLGDMNQSLKEVEGILDQSKKVFTHIVDNITGSDLIDSELVHAASTLIESIHLNIAEFISIYKQKLKFVEKIKLMIFQQQQRIELANLKHKQNLELIEAKKKETSSENVQDGEYEFNTDAIIKKMQTAEMFSVQNIESTDFDDDDDEEDDDEEDEDGRPKKKKK